MNRSTGLGIFRLIACLLIIKNMCSYLPMANDLFGINGIFPYDIYLGLLAGYKLQFLAYPFYLPLAPQIYLMLIIVLAAFYSIGFGGRLSGALLFTGLMILKFRNGFILDGSDNVMQVTLPFLVIADDLSFFRYKPKRIRPEGTINAFAGIGALITKYATIGLLIQVCYVYFFTALAKLQGSLWLNGTAVYYTMRVQEFMATKWNIPLTENHYFVVLSTYFTLIIEMAFPFLIWFRQTKYWLIIMTAMLHIGIWIFMRIDNFSWIMIGSYFTFITDKEYLAFVNFFERRRLTVFIDSWCPNCTRTAIAIKNLDFLNFIVVKDLRNDLSPEDKIDANIAMQKMAGVANGKIYYGYDTLYQISLRLPLLLIFFPISFLFKITRIGHLFYNELAIKRKILPLNCDVNCKIK